MSVVTAVLGEESGIQYQGVQDKSGGMGQAVPSTLITGKYRRGVYGRTMTITTANIRGMLGYEPENPDYQAVEDALSTGIPSVQVLRLSGGLGDCQPIGYSFNRHSDVMPEFSNIPHYIDFSINSGKKQRITLAASQYQQILDFMIRGINELSEQTIFMGGSGGDGYFQSSTSGYEVTPATKEMLDEQGGLIEPINLTLYSVPGQAEDPVKMYFKADKYEMHSCGSYTWDGY